jgi:hypothetical protein
MAVMDFANVMRLQAVIGNTVLIIESEMFGQPTLRAKWKKQHGGRPEDIQGLAVEEHVARLRDQLLPLVEKTQRLAREHLEAVGRMRQAPSLSVERAEAVNVILLSPAASQQCGHARVLRERCTSPRSSRSCSGEPSLGKRERRR